MSEPTKDWHERLWRVGNTERALIAYEIESLADSADSWGVTRSRESVVVRHLRELAAIVRDPGDITAERWTEVRVTGQPPGGYSPYDFTFRSDAKTWEDRHKIAARALAEWSNGSVQTREVYVETRTTEWVDAPDDPS